MLEWTKPAVKPVVFFILSDFTFLAYQNKFKKMGIHLKNDTEQTKYRS